MDKAATLTKAIEKAIANGWNDGGLVPFEYYHEFSEVAVPFKHPWLELEDGSTVNMEAVIFNHDFAKALWPGESPEKGFELWKFHLQMMVVVDDPISYLGAHLE